MTSMRLRGCWHITGPSTHSSSREPYDRIRLYLAVFVQPNTATAHTIPAVNYTIWGADGMATAAIQNSRTPVAYSTAHSPSSKNKCFVLIIIFMHLGVQWCGLVMDRLGLKAQARPSPALKSPGQAGPKPCSGPCPGPGLRC